MSNKPLIIERTLDAPVKAVWEALTDNEKMKQWYFNLASFNPVVGFEISLLLGKKNSGKNISYSQISFI